MVKFNELKITQDGSNLIIEAQIIDGAKYENIYLDKIIIDNQNTFISSGPSTTPIYQLNIPENINKKGIVITLTQEDFSDLINKTLFFVYVTTRGDIDNEELNSNDKPGVLGVVANLYPFYQKSINFYAKEFNDSCIIPKSFIDFILKQKALEISIKTGNYVESILLWNKYLKDIDKFFPFKNCGYYGSNH